MSVARAWQFTVLAPRKLMVGQHGPMASAEECTSENRLNFWLPHIALHSFATLLASWSAPSSSMIALRGLGDLATAE
eukprot:12958667-Alexandrium_andersonii.AAC.1